ncbi:cytochrome b/b6 domain-containing protein [Enterobacteriaceae bacterium BIT-l23]|uniref:cytochrome b n=1 Tax=Jejubacter sp. L23 TaxID=3092086 RepID=UPI001585BA18|nr:cytochrome b/b6 domain-containing protein [Enterobacteriaceae bacterium BIT-l23]
MTSAVSCRYDFLSRLLHWGVAAIIIYATIMGYILHSLDGSRWFDFFSELNMSLATIATPVMVIRFVWRFFRPPVGWPSYISTRKKQLVTFIHEIFYLTIFIVLISGFLMLEKGYHLFWLIPVPQPLSSPEVNQFFFKVHRISCMALGVLLVIHITAVANYLRQGKKEILNKMR